MLYGYLKPYLGRMSLGLAIKFVGTIMDLLLPWILAKLIDDVVPQENLRLIIFWGVIMVICSVLAVVTNILANRMASLVARNSTEQIRHDLFTRISFLSSRQVDYFTIPSLVSRLTSDTYNVHQMTGMMQRLGVRAPILLIGGIAMTLTLEPTLAMIMVAMLPIIGALLVFVSKKGIPLYTAQQRAVDKLVKIVRENFTGIRVIKALSMTEYERSRLSDVNAKVVKAEKRAGYVMSLTNPTVSLFLNVGMTLVILLGAYRVNSGLTQPGTIIAFSSYFTIILNAMLMVNRMFTSYSKGVASAGRIAEVLDCRPELEVRALPPAETAARVEFRNVSFSYTGGENAVEDISFSLQPGQMLGIIGPTGCGKTTLVSLLLRFYDPDQGQILLNGQDLRAIPQEVLHTYFGVAFQNDFLMAGTIRENIDFGRSLTDAQIDTAVQTAQAAEFIEASADGLQSHLASRGSNFSGGQKQRMLIARALAARPEILILDDSSSALDYKTDASLRQALGREYGGLTSIIIAQRISSIAGADHILVLDQGRVLGYGSHAELLQTCPGYREIYESQMGEVRL